MRPTLTLLLSLALAGLPAIAASTDKASGHAPVAAAAPALTAGANQATPLRLPRIHLHGDALAGKERSLSIDEIDTLVAPVEWTIADPYKRIDNRYQGITLQDLVQTLAPSALHVRMRAVNDYITVFERREWETLPILLATRDEGARMTVADKGPARIIYRQTRDNEMQMQIHAPKWIWQVIDVEFSSH